MKLIKIITVYLMLFAVAIINASEITATKVKSPPVIDGKLDEKVWESAKTINKFLRMDTDVLSDNKTEARIIYTDSAIFFGIKCYIADKGALKSEKRDRDDRVWDDDCVEVMVDVNNGKTNFYHIIVNPSNSIYDSICDQGGFVSDSKWDGQIKTAAFAGEKFWSCEIMIPFYTLEDSCKSTWGVNICREVKAPVELSSIASNGRFKNAGSFPSLTLDVDFSKYYWDIAISNVKTALKDGKPEVKLDSSLTNHTGKPYDVQVDCLFIDPNNGLFSVSKEMRLGNKENKPLLLEKSLEKQGTYKCYISVIDVATQLPLKRKQFPLNISYVPMAIELIAPWYKNAIFATQKIENIILDVNFSMQPSELRELCLKVYVRGKGTGAAIESKQIAAVAATNRVMFDAQKLPDGKFEIVAELFDKNGKIKASTVQDFRKLPYKKGEVWRGQDMNWYIDGKKFFLIGSWGEPDKCIKELNAVLLNHIDIANPQRIADENLRKMLASEDMKLLGSLMHIPAGDTPIKCRAELPEQVVSTFSKYVKEMSCNPQLFAYYYVDEPEVMGDAVNGVKKGYELISELDPYHPAIISNDSVAGMKEFAEGGDINGLHCYPGPSLKESMHDFEKVVYYMKNGGDCLRNAKHKQTIAYLYGGFNYGDFGATATRIPTYEELRNQCMLAVIMGSKGLIIYEQQIAHYPELYIGRPYLFNEQRCLSPAFLAEDANLEIHCSEPDAKYCLKKLNNDYWLFVSNATRKTGNIKFTIPALNNKSLQVVSERRKVHINEGSFSDSFTPFQVHVYATDMEFPELKTVNEINAEIAKENSKRRKPGNLAFQMFEDEHVSLSASSNKITASGVRKDTGLWHVTDGIIDKENIYRLESLVWHDDTPNKSPDWIELKLDKPETIGKVIVYPFGKTIKDYQAQAFINQKWQTVAEITNKHDDVIVTEFTPIVTDRIRIWVTATNGPTAKISEIELYK
jgi:hypothetical protein